MRKIWNARKISFADGSEEYCLAVSPVVGCKKQGSSDGRSLPAGDYFTGNVKYVYVDDEGNILYDDDDYLDDVDLSSLHRILLHEIDSYSPEFLARRAARSCKESARRARRSVEIIGRANTWKYFITLTFDPKRVDRYSYDAVTSEIKKWDRALRRRYPNVAYLLVFERHKDGAWHAHALMSGCDLRLVYARMVKGERIYNMPLEYDLGFTTVTMVRDSGKAALYLSKYIGKALGSVPKGKKSYWATRNLLRPEDVTETMLFDTDEWEIVRDTVFGIADKVNKVVVESIGQIFYYCKVFAASPVPVAVAPT